MKATCKKCGRRWEASECRAKAKGGYVCPWCATRNRRRYIFGTIGFACFLLLFGTVGGMERDRTSLLVGMLLCMLWLAGMAISAYLGDAFYHKEKTALGRQSEEAARENVQPQLNKKGAVCQ